jgi:hypothetical protein
MIQTHGLTSLYGLGIAKKVALSVAVAVKLGVRLRVR